MLRTIIRYAKSYGRTYRLALFTCPYRPMIRLSGEPPSGILLPPGRGRSLHSIAPRDGARQQNGVPHGTPF
ncbi:hypothetical protein LJK88_07680 [Paenibacillus sp. P26]|nr:hypothetical protein LJK88_07680 [Paenibacillus sp. P26]